MITFDEWLQKTHNIVAEELKGDQKGTKPAPPQDEKKEKELKMLRRARTRGERSVSPSGLDYSKYRAK